EELRIARYPPPVEKRGADGVVLARRLQALLEIARGVAGLEARVPEGAVKLLGDALGPLVPLAGQEREQIDVGPRRQLAPPVAARRDQRKRRFDSRRNLRADRREQGRNHVVGERGD